MLSGTNTYTGTTTVNGGVLSVNGSIASSSLLTVNCGGTLGGTGSVATTHGQWRHAGARQLDRHASTSPAISPSAPGSTYAVEVSPAAADSTNVTGTADLSGGTVDVTYAAGTFVAKSYTILDAAAASAAPRSPGLTRRALTGLTHQPRL